MLVLLGYEFQKYILILYCMLLMTSFVNTLLFGRVIVNSSLGKNPLVQTYRHRGLKDEDSSASLHLDFKLDAARMPHRWVYP